MVKRFRLSLAFACGGLFVFLSACAAANTLSRAQAIRIADAEARRHVHHDLQQYERAPVFHEGGRWYVGYRQHGKKFVDFGIDVYDKTKKASVLIVD
jgi:hypothetical protein